jgi:hypothetical protein
MTKYTHTDRGAYLPNGPLNYETVQEAYAAKPSADDIVCAIDPEKNKWRPLTRLEEIQCVIGNNRRLEFLTLTFAFLVRIEPKRWLKGVNFDSYR